jgi:hypothetical protein
MSYFDNKPHLSENDKKKAINLTEKQKSEALTPTEKNWLSEVYKKGKAPPANPDMPWKSPKKVIDTSFGKNSAEKTLETIKETKELLREEIKFNIAKEAKPVEQTISETEKILESQQSRPLNEEEKEWIKSLNNKPKEEKKLIEISKELSLLEKLQDWTSWIILISYALLMPIYIGYEMYQMNNVLKEISQSLQDKSHESN